VRKLVTALAGIGRRLEGGELQRGFGVLVEEIRESVGEVFAEAGRRMRVSREGVEEVDVPREVPVVERFVGCELLA
jgi:hypothetical protein